jgi:RNA 2',3'-cyclic 3'-phosphodiesterase
MRLFIATSFPPEVLRDLNDRVAQLRPRLPAASWVRPETQHLTLAFLGEQKDPIVDQLEEPLRAVCAKLPAFEASITSCGFFPNPRHARVGWMGLEPDGKFVEAATAVRTVVTKLGLTLDGAEFKPHLTLLRVRDPWPPASIDLFSRSFREYRSTHFAVDRITLFSSQLSPKGAIHTAQATFALGSA